MNNDVKIVFRVLAILIFAVTLLVYITHIRG